MSAAVLAAALLFLEGCTQVAAASSTDRADGGSVEPLPSISDVEQALMSVTGETLMSMSRLTCRVSFSDDDVTSYYCTFVIGHQDANVLQSESGVFFRTKKPQQSRLTACSKGEIGKSDRCSTALPI